MMLTKLERNRIYETIRRSGLDPAEFDLEGAGRNVTITHTSGSTFEINQRSPVTKILQYMGILGRYKTIAAASDDLDELGTADSIDEIITHLSSWLEAILLSVGMPDLWEEMRRGGELITDIQKANSDNTSFTEDEQGKIAAHLQEITKQLKEQFELTSEQAKRIDEWRDEVVEASTRMGRKDWIVYVLGTITALTIAATVPAGLGEHIFTMVIHALGYLFTGGSEPPQILG